MNELDHTILFFGSFILIFALLEIIAYMLVWRGVSNCMYVVALLYTPILREFMFGSPWEEYQ